MASFAGASPPSSSLTGMSHPKVVDLLAKIASGDKPSHIDLSNCGLQEIPEQIYDLGDAVEMLNLGGNELSDLPDSIARLTKLRILFFAQNNFRCIPRILGTLSSLYMLSFKSNHIETIHPDALSPSVGWLILTNNHITQLPATIGNLKVSTPTYELHLTLALALMTKYLTYHNDFNNHIAWHVLQNMVVPST